MQTISFFVLNPNSTLHLPFKLQWLFIIAIVKKIKSKKNSPSHSHTQLMFFRDLLRCGYLKVLIRMWICGNDSVIGSFLRCLVYLSSDYKQFHYTINGYTTVLRISDIIDGKRWYSLAATTETEYIDNSVMYRDIIKVLTKLVAERFGVTTILFHATETFAKIVRVAVVCCESFLAIWFYCWCY